jgi:hypothetical protein
MPVAMKKTLTLTLSVSGRGDPYAAANSTYSITQTDNSIALQSRIGGAKEERDIREICH